VNALMAEPAVKPAPEAFDIHCADGRELAAHWFGALAHGAPARRGTLVISGGTGFRQSFYFKLAGYAAARGYDSLVYDYRGIGWSAPPDLAKETARMSDWGLLDMRAALDTAARRGVGAPIATLGHSIGGQFLGLLTNHSLARAHVHVATSVGYWRWEHAPFRYLAWWFWYVHGPVMLRTRGYIPSGGGWSGLPLPRGVFEEWKRWCTRTSHFQPDLATYLSDNVFASIRAPILSLAFEDDPIATRRTTEALRGFFPSATFDVRWYAPRDVGGRIGHAGFFLPRFADSMWKPTFDWLDAKLGSAA
jgi:predicted alpha/beta hydrolase